MKNGKPNTALLRNYEYGSKTKIVKMNTSLTLNVAIIHYNYQTFTFFISSVICHSYLGLHLTTLTTEPKILPHSLSVISFYFYFFYQNCIVNINVHKDPTDFICLTCVSGRISSWSHSF
jgi:hypothetical protein